MRRAVAVAGAAAILLGPAVGVASASGTPSAGLVVQTTDGAVQGVIAGTEGA